jgi:hypothetical protein
MPSSKRQTLLIGGGLAALVIAASAGTATAAKLINSSDIKDNSLQSVDIKNGQPAGRGPQEGRGELRQGRRQVLGGRRPQGLDHRPNKLSASAKEQLKTTYAELVGRRPQRHRWW